MKKIKLSLLLLASSLLFSCGEAGSTSSNTVSSSNEETLQKDKNYRYLRAHLIGLSNIDKIESNSNNSFLDYEFKQGTVYKDPLTNKFGFLPSFSGASHLTVKPKKIDALVTGLTKNKIREVEMESHVKKAKITTNSNSPLGGFSPFNSDDCSFDSYLKEGVFYLKPNADARRFINWGVRFMLYKKGASSTDFAFPEEGGKFIPGEENLNNIDNSTLLPISKRLSAASTSLLNDLITNYEIVDSVELKGGKPLYRFNVTMIDVQKTLLNSINALHLDELTSPSEKKSLSEVIEQDVKPFLETIKYSETRLSLTYDQSQIISSSTESTFTFDEEKAKTFILTRDSLEAGAVSIPLSLNIRKDTNYNFSTSLSVSYPDLTVFKEVEMPI